MSRIPQQFIDDLLARVDIVDVIDSRIKLKKAGKNFVACCPFHKEKTPSFTVSADKQFYYCFGCGATGTALGFILEFDNANFIDAVETLARSVGLTVPREQSTQPTKTYKDLYSILEKARQYYETQLKEGANRQEAVSYLKNRGLSGAIAKSFGLGYAPPGWDNLLVKLGLSEEDRNLLQESGLLIVSDDKQKRYDRFRHRVMFPIIDLRGRTIGFGGRRLDSPSGTSSSDTRQSGPKYLNSPETPIFHKGRELYGLFHAKNQSGKLERLLIVEGYMDVIALAQFGIHYAVATLGTACGEEHLHLAFKQANEITFCFDGDNAGRQAAKRALDNALPQMSDGRQVRFLFLPEGQDPDSLVRQVGKERFESLITSATPLEDFFFESIGYGIDTQTIEGRAKFSKLAAPLLHKLPNGVYRELMFGQLAKRTGLNQEVLRELTESPATAVSDTPPHAQHAPAPKQRIPTPQPPRTNSSTSNQAAVRLNPARLAATLLLDQPEILRRPVDTTLPQPYDSADIETLAKLIDYVKAHPNCTFHTILGHWGGQYGLEAQRSLAQMIATQFLGDAQKISTYDNAKEFEDALTRIRADSTDKARDNELRQLSSMENLTEAQKERLRNLLKAKSHSKIKTN